MGEKLIDDLARALAQPMPRRRALRVVGASLAAIAVPGFSPRAARAASGSRSLDNCPIAHECCSRFNQSAGKFEYKDCGWPSQRYDCKIDGVTCVDLCPPWNAALKKRQVATWLTDSYSKEPKKYDCCIVPDFIPRDGECILNCPYTIKGSVQCGDKCCIRGQKCRNGRCLACPPNEVACEPEDGGPSKCCCPGGRARCGSRCCPPNAVCADPRRSRCEKCAPGTEECGSKCCPRGSYCCNSKKGVCCSDKNGSCCGDSPICCEKRDCCQVASSRLPVCCPPGETCGLAGNAAGLVPGSRPTSICCTPDRVVRLTAATICCPSGTVSMRGQLIVPAGGGGGLCCNTSRACGSGNSITCCGPGQTCQSGRCV